MIDELYDEVEKEGLAVAILGVIQVGIPLFLVLAFVIGMLSGV